MRVDRHESVLGRWEMAWSDPDPRLRAFVRGYAGYVEITPARLRRRELAERFALLDAAIVRRVADAPLPPREVAWA